MEHTKPDIDTTPDLEGQWEDYHQGLELLKQQGLTATPDPFGSYCGLRIDKKSKPLELKGISYPDSFVMRQEITELDDFLLMAEAFYGARDTGELRESAFKLWTPVFESVPRPQLSKLFGMVQMCRSMNEKEQLKATHLERLGICPFPGQVLSTLESVYAFIPEASWFCEDLQCLEPEDIVTLFPKADLEILMLLLGRALTGPSNSLWPGHSEPWIHTARTAVAIVGDAGVGKSTLIKMLLDTMSILGYKTVSFDGFGGQFGLERIIRSSIAFRDDLDDRSFKAIMKSGTAKSIVTSGTVPTERKYMEARDVRAVTTLIANANRFDPHWASQFDSGSLNRWKILNTHSSDDLLLDGDRRPFKFIPELADSLGVDTEAVLAWFLRMCADRFITEVRNDTLETTVKSLGAQLQNSFPIDLPEALASLAVFFWLVGNLDFKHLSFISFVGYMCSEDKPFTFAANRKFKEFMRKDYEQKPRMDHPHRILDVLELKTLRKVTDIAHLFSNPLKLMEPYDHASEIVYTTSGYRITLSGRMLFKAFTPQSLELKANWLQGVLESFQPLYEGLMEWN